MDTLWQLAVHKLGELSAPGVLTSFIGSLATFVGVVIGHAWHTRRKLDRDVQAIPATPVLPMSDANLHARLAALEVANHRLSYELGESQRLVDELSKDCRRSSTTINAQSLLIDALREELEESHRQRNASHTRLPALPAHSQTAIVVTEIDESPTLRPPKIRR